MNYRSINITIENTTNLANGSISDGREISAIVPDKYLKHIDDIANADITIITIGGKRFEKVN